MGRRRRKKEEEEKACSDKTRLIIIFVDVRRSRNTGYRRLLSSEVLQPHMVDQMHDFDRDPDEISTFEMEEAS